MAVTPNIKIDTSMIKEFSSPVSNNENVNTYLHVNSNKEIDYLTIQEVIEDINNAGGISGGGGDNGSSLEDWDSSNTYVEGDTVIYNNSIYKCKVESSKKDVFDINDWTLLAGYSKQSYFYYNPEEQITQIVLPEEVADKGAFNVNVNNLLLQSNNYGLESDNKTITFFEPIAPDTNIEVIVYGNMIIPTDVSNVVVKDFTAVVDNTSTFELNEIIAKKELITVNIENQVILNTEWDLDDTRTKVVLKNPVPKDTRVQISYFNNLELKLSATFTPHLERDDNITTTLSWTNDGGLVNPADSYIYDGVTFTPHTSKTGVHTTISWTNNGEKENPTDVIVSDGATFTPDVSKSGYETSITWSNDNGLPNPDNVVILDGIKYIPNVSKTDYTTTISWSNDQGATNPNTVIIEDGATFTPHTTQGVHEATISFTNDKNLENPETISIYTNYAQRIVESFTATENQTTFVASHEIYDKSVLSVNVGNTELTAAAYSLGADKKTVTLVNGLSAGTLVDLKYFYNLNFGTEGTTFTPVLTPIENGYTLSWTNNGEMENPEPVNITSGSSINFKGTWSDTESYVKNDYVTFEDSTATYGYVAISETVAAGTALTDTNSWAEMYKILKTYIAATIKDWGE